MKKIVLIGGGHSHAIALLYWRKWNITSDSDITISLISDVQYTPYSGMLPGLIAGLYTYEQSHIDLRKLTQSLSAQLIIDRVINIEPDLKQVICQSGKIVEFDVLSIDIGSTPQIDNIQGAKQFATRAKPVGLLLEKWQEVIEQGKHNSHQQINLSIIGGQEGLL